MKKKSKSKKHRSEEIGKPRNNSNYSNHSRKDSEGFFRQNRLSSIKEESQQSMASSNLSNFSAVPK